jgi:uncharacterized protein (DUF488 family)
MMTIGHSNRSAADFLAILQAHGVETLVDVRTVPKSRYNPQFNRDTLPATLQSAGIQYLHLPALGGLRHARKDSTNLGWRNAGFRGYADYMQTPEFAAALDSLIALPGRVAVMCAEAVPWRCHRSMIADALTARAIPVEHIMSIQSKNLHKMTAFARVEGTRITYPGDTLELFQEEDTGSAASP